MCLQLHSPPGQKDARSLLMRFCLCEILISTRDIRNSQKYYEVLFKITSNFYFKIYIEPVFYWQVMKQEVG